MSRQVGDERARYRRKGLREQIDDAFSWPAAHPIATLVILAFLVVGTLFFGSRALFVRPESLAVGDCLYIRTAAIQDESRPIGSERQVSDVLLAGGAERAGCGSSHGHEVSAIVMPFGSVAPSRPPGETGFAMGPNEMRAMTLPLCQAAFEDYVGRPLADSRYLTFPAVPDIEGGPSWLEGQRRTVCLVARRDGAWMDHPAHGSGE